MKNPGKIFLVMFLLAVTADAASFRSKYERLIAKADRYYSWFAYPKSVRFYQKAMDETEGFEAYPVRRVAEAYAQMNQPAEAEIWYAMLEANGELSDDDKIRYSNVLMQNGNDQKARSIVASVKQESTEREALMTSLTDKAVFYRDSSAYDLSGLSFNSDQNDFSPAYYGDGLVFVSNRKTKSLGQNTYYWDGTYFLDLFYSDLSGEAPKPVSGKINTSFHEGPAVFYDADQKVIFTRNNFNLGEKEVDLEGVNHLNLYYAEKKKNGKWGKAEPMPFNGEGYSVGHPALSADGKTLYFCSDMEGTNGKSDLFRSRFVDGQWSRPEHLGNHINTPEDELFPFLADDNVLYFASGGHPGLGGLDIYRVDLNRQDAAVENLGYPINTENDDFGLIVKNNHGYLSSNRRGGLGKDDIYELMIHQLLVKARMKDAGTGEPVVGDLHVIDQLDSALLDEVNDQSATGEFEVKRGRHLAVTASATGYDDQVLFFNTLEIPEELSSYTIDVPMLKYYRKGNVLVVYRPLDQDVVQLTGDVALYEGTLEELKSEYQKQRIEIENIYEVSSIYYDFDQSTIREDAAVQLDRLAEVMEAYPSLKVLLWAHTDSRGSRRYNDALAKRRALSARTYLLARGISDDRIFLDFSGEQQLVNDCADGVNCPEPQHQNNRRTEISIK